MQTADVVVALGGDIQNTVPKSDVTPAEYLVLAAVHGGFDAIRSVTPTGDVKRDAKEEVARLREAYPLQGRVVAQLFAGYNPNVPEKFEQVLPVNGEAPPSVELPSPQTAEERTLAADLIG